MSKTQQKSFVSDSGKGSCFIGSLIFDSWCSGRRSSVTSIMEVSFWTYICSGNIIIFSEAGGLFRSERYDRNKTCICHTPFKCFIFVICTLTADFGWNRPFWLVYLPTDWKISHLHKCYAPKYLLTMSVIRTVLVHTIIIWRHIFPHRPCVQWKNWLAHSIYHRKIWQVLYARWRNSRRIYVVRTAPRLRDSVSTVGYPHVNARR